MAWKYNWNTTTTTMGNVTTPPPDIWDTWYEDVTRMRALVDENHALVIENQDLLKQIGALVVENQREIGIIRNVTQNENKTLGSLEAEITGLKTDDTKQGKTIKNLNERVDELEKKECQIGTKDQWTENGIKGNFSRNERDVQRQTTFDVTFHKSFSDTPEILLSPIIVFFKKNGIQGWIIELDTVTRTGFTFILTGWDEEIEVDYFRINYMACV